MSLLAQFFFVFALTSIFTLQKVTAWRSPGKTKADKTLSNICPFKKFIDNTQKICKDHCSDGYFTNYGSQICELCDHNCETCNLNKTRCTSCPQNMFLNKNTCVHVSNCVHTLIHNNNESTIRLVNGSSSLEGRIEIRVNNVWGTVCDDMWTKKEGDVICRMLEMGHAIQTYSSAYFGSASDSVPIYIDNLRCDGSESSLDECLHSEFGVHDCSHKEDAGVKCSGPNFQRSCVKSCGKGFYKSGNQCLPCHENCASCTENAEKCTSCFTGQFLQGSRCISRCQSGHYGHTASQTCKPCKDPNCISCESQGDTSVCKLCVYNTFLSNGKCRVKCGKDEVVQTFLNLHTSAAGSPLYTLERLNLSSATRQYYGDVFLETVQGEIDVCDKDWDMADAHVVCRYLGRESALAATRGSQFNSIPRDEGKTSPKYMLTGFKCKGNEVDLLQCEHEVVEAGKCLSSDRAGVVCGFGVPPAYHNSPYQCLSSCDRGFYNSSGQCLLCSVECATCVGHATHCTSCKAPLFLSNNKCISHCGIFEYGNNSSKKCMPCNTEKCGTCQNGEKNDICLSCNEPLVLWQSRCVRQCPKGHARKEGQCVTDCGAGLYLEKDRCVKCPESCLACKLTNASKVECLICESSKVLNLRGTCSNACLFPNVEITSDSRADLLGLNVKLSGTGTGGHVLMKRGNRWVFLCNNEITQKEKQVICRELNLLPPDSMVSSYSTDGLEDYKGYVAKLRCKGNEKSVSECYQSPGVTEFCSSSDVYIECSGSLPRVCKKECPKGYTFDSSQNKCVKCSMDCTACHGNRYNCSSCKPHRILRKTSCQYSCGVGFVEDRKSQKCVACDRNCRTCDESDPKHCRSCNRGYYLKDRSCVRNCGDDYTVKLSKHLEVEITNRYSSDIQFKLKITHGDRSGYVCTESEKQWNSEDFAVVCRELHFGVPILEAAYAYPSYVSEPVWIKPNHCHGNESSLLECGYLQYKAGATCTKQQFYCKGPDLSRICMPDCPMGYIVTESHTCQQCHPSCAQCAGTYSNCTECNTGYVQVQPGICNLECPRGYYQDKDSICQKCGERCATCFGSATNCTACEGDFRLQDGNCVRNCASGLFYYGDSSVSGYRKYWQLIPLLKTSTSGLYYPICNPKSDDISTARVLCRSLGYYDINRMEPTDYGDGSMSNLQCYATTYVKCSGYENHLRECKNFTGIVADAKSKFVRLICKDGELSKRCIGKCPDGFAVVGKECKRCKAHCTSCSGAEGTCLGCNIPFYLESGKCVQQCKKGYYGNVIDRTCKPCHANCRSCANGDSEIYCLSCKDGFVRHHSRCIEKAPENSVFLRSVLSRMWKRNAVRLSGGLSGLSSEGLLQVYHDNEWMEVCSSRPSYLDLLPELVCFELGYSGGQRWERAKDVKGLKRNGASRGKALDLVTCFPHMKSLRSCLHNGFGVTQCSDYDDLYINCTSKRASLDDYNFYQDFNGAPCFYLAQGCSRMGGCMDVSTSKGRKDSICMECPRGSILEGRICRWIVNERLGVWKPLQDLTVNEGESVDLVWSPEWPKSDPNFDRKERYRFTPRWYKDGKLITMNNNYNGVFPYNGLGYSFPLTIKALPETSGNYTSVFATTAGDVTSSMILTVIAKPRVSLAKSPVHPKLGKPCELLCESSEKVTWSWYHGEKLVSGNKYDMSKPGRLVIRKLEKADVGQYKCIAKSKVGEGMAVLEVKPAVTIKSIEAADVIVPEGGTATMKCIVDADGPVKLAWKIWGRALPLNLNYAVSRIEQGVLTIKKVSVDEQAIYTCVAISDAMVMAKDVKLLIKGGSPHIFSPPKDVFAIRAATIRFYCHAIGAPTLTYTWLRNNDVIGGSDTHGRVSEDGTMLELLYVHDDQSAVYTCRVSNGFGSDQRAAQLRVLEVDIKTDNQSLALKKKKAFLPSFGDAIFQVVFGPILGAILFIVVAWCGVKYIRRRRRRATLESPSNTASNGTGPGYAVQYHIQERNMDVLEEEDEMDYDNENLEVVRYDDEHNPERALLVPSGSTVA